MRFAPEHARRVGDRLSVIAARRRGDPALQLFRGELRQEVDAAPHLERAEPLVVLVLDVNLAGADQLFEPDVPMKGRPGDIVP